MGELNAEEPRELGDGGRGWPMARGSLHLSMFDQGDHLYDERDACNIRVLVADDHRVESNVVEVDRQGEGERVVVADPVRRMDPTGNLEGEVLVEHHRNSSTRSTSMPRVNTCLLYTSPSPRDGLLSRMPS